MNLQLESPLLRFFACVFAICSFFGTAPSSAQLLSEHHDWVLKRDRSGIKIFTAKVTDSKYRAVSGRMIVAGSVESLVGLVSDLEKCPEWAAMCEMARIERRMSNTESYIYTLNDLPFPVRDRDIFSHVVWQHNPDTGVVRMKSSALAEYKPTVKGVVRVNEAKSEWVFSPQPFGRVLVQTFVHIDPNGPVPAWVVNRLIVGSPYKTMLRMREIVESGAYKDYQLSF